jgi:hypothetical protein
VLYGHQILSGVMVVHSKWGASSQRAQERGSKFMQ